MPRANAISIYLREGLDDDDLLIRLWAVCRERSRPQEMFRRMLIKGFDALVADGEISQTILNALEEEKKKGPTWENRPRSIRKPVDQIHRPQDEREAVSFVLENEPEFDGDIASDLHTAGPGSDPEPTASESLRKPSQPPQPPKVAYQDPPQDKAEPDEDKGKGDYGFIGDIM